jgi:hypothetical protein
MAPSATMARRASCSRNSSARVVEAVGIGRYSDLLFSGAADPDIVILAHVGRPGAAVPEVALKKIAVA